MLSRLPQALAKKIRPQISAGEFFLGLDRMRSFHAIFAPLSIFFLTFAKKAQYPPAGKLGGIAKKSQYFMGEMPYR